MSRNYAEELMKNKGRPVYRTRAGKGEVHSDDIKELQTLKTQYDMDSIEVVMRSGKTYRMKVEDILPLIRGEVLKVEKARKHEYLKPRL